jgi:hypothetical protein
LFGDGLHCAADKQQADDQGQAWAPIFLENRYHWVHPNPDKPELKIDD